MAVQIGEMQMRNCLIAVLLLAGCSSDPGTRQPAEGEATSGSGRIPVETPSTSLVGLYEGGPAASPHQICMVEQKGETRFGLVIWGANAHSCSGSGTVRREDGRIVMEMAGDSACAVEARLDGGRLRLAAEQPVGCSYYCGARARLGGAELVRTGSTEADARRARDLVGDPLCPGA